MLRDSHCLRNLFTSSQLLKWFVSNKDFPMKFFHEDYHYKSSSSRILRTKFSIELRPQSLGNFSMFGLRSASTMLSLTHLHSNRSLARKSIFSVSALFWHHLIISLINNLLFLYVKSNFECDKSHISLRITSEMEMIRRHQRSVVLFYHTEFRWLLSVCCMWLPVVTPVTYW